MGHAFIHFLLTKLSPFVLDKLSPLIKEEIGLIWGADKELKKISSTLTAIQAVLEDAEMKQFESKAIQDWLRKLNDLAYEIDDILDECATEASQLEYKDIFSRYSLQKILYRHNVGTRMKEVRKDLDAVAADRANLHLNVLAEERPRGVAASRETGHVLKEPDHVFGRDEDKEKIVGILLNQVEDGTRGFSVLPIIGVGGLGKTTLAQLIFNDQRVVGHFEERIWVCVSDNFDVKTLIEAVIQFVTGSASDLVQLGALQLRLGELLNQKKYLLVLDDVWNEDRAKWSELRNALPCGSSGSSIIITTRLNKVADIMGTLPTHRLKGLSDEGCWVLLRENAFGQEKEEYPNLEAIGKQIVKKCAGVPLAAKTLGGLLQFKRTESYWNYVNESELWALPQEETSILPALKLSYHHLPLELRQCFAYCAVFPKDSDIKKDELIFCWMAHGYISAKGKLEVEEVGNEVCNELVLRSLLQEAPGREKPTFNMHDLVHDLAQSIMENKIPGAQVERSIPHAPNDKVRQVNMGKKYAAFPKSYHPEMDMHSILRGCSRLRILDASPKDFPCSILDLLDVRLTYLLDVRLTYLPSAVGNLKHLRYLNLSYSIVRSLPESLCSLWNLKILNLTNCNHLAALPKNMRRLKNLRHLILEECTSLKEMPPKIGELTCLRTLSKFIVDRERGYQLEELQLLNLGGKLEIRHLERVQNPMDARKANLSEKKDLHCLELVWLERKDASKSKGEDVDEKVLEALEPHPNLETLIIEGFIGRCFPSWMATPKKLVRIEIKDCRNCLQLPQLGEWPHLKELLLRNVEAVEYMIEGGDQGGASNVLFPSLEQLTLHSLPNLKGLLKGQSTRAGTFPQLWRVEIKDCSITLASFANLPTLDTLDLKINTSMMRSDSILIEILENLINLKELVIFGVASVAEEGMRALESLTKLEIRSSEIGACLPEGWFRHLSTTLESLTIWCCWEVVDLGEGMKYLHNLKTLRLGDLRKMVRLPEAIQHLSSSLQHLTLWRLPELASLPDWMGNLTSLQELQIEDCEKIASLPESMGGMVNLKILNIHGCPALKKRCETEKGADWHKIAHIPYLFIS